MAHGLWQRITTTFYPAFEKSLAAMGEETERGEWVKEAGKTKQISGSSDGFLSKQFCGGLGSAQVSA